MDLRGEREKDWIKFWRKAKKGSGSEGIRTEAREPVFPLKVKKES